MLVKRKKKKVVIQVAGNPQYAKKTPQSQLILNPATGLPGFGSFPAINTQRVIFSGGPIYLRYGVHSGPSRGWGFEHIWQARFPNCPDQQSAIPEVTGLINRILIPGATIHYEFGLGSGERRSSIFKNSAGIVIVEERMDGQNKIFYGIVTAFCAHNVNGPVIGAI